MLPVLEYQQLVGIGQINKWDILDKIMKQKKEITALETIVNSRLA